MSQVSRIVARHWIFILPLAIYAAYYSIQNFVPTATAPIDVRLTFVALMCISIFSYFVGYVFVPVRWAQRLVGGRLPANIGGAAAAVSLVLFALCLIIACATAEHVPLFEALRGATGGDLANWRETFLKARTDTLGIVLNYTYAIFIAAVAALTVTYAYYARLWWRHFALAILALGLSLTLEKGAFSAAAFPLIALFLMQRRFLAAAGAAASFVLFLVLMYYLASGRVGEIIHATPESTVTATVASQIAPDPQVVNGSATPAKYNITGRTDQLSLAVNRVVWIPYITALDWLRYQHEVLKGQLVLGRSIKPFAALTRQTPIYLEREVANFEWGQNATGTASSNTVFFVDAWLNFGVVGVLVYSMIFGFIVRLIVASNYPPLLAASIVPVWLMCFEELPPVLFSGGLGFLIVIALLVGDGVKDEDAALATARAPG